MAATKDNEEDPRQTYDIQTNWYHAVSSIRAIFVIFILFQDNFLITQVLEIKHRKMILQRIHHVFIIN